MERTSFRGQFTHIADACALAQGIVDTVREPVLVLDKELRVMASMPLAAHSILPSRSALRIRKADSFTRWVMDNGTFQNFECCWKKLYPNTA